MDTILILIAFVIMFAALLSPIAFLIGLYKVIFQKEDKKFGIQLLIYSSIAIIIGLGTCISMGGFMRI